MEGLDDDWHVPERRAAAPAKFIPRGQGARPRAPLGEASAGRGRKQTHAVAGLQVAFPFPPYACQIDFMAAIIQALQVCNWQDKDSRRPSRPVPSSRPERGVTASCP